MPAAGQKKEPARGGAGASSFEADGRGDVEDDLLAEEFAEIDAVLARSSSILSGAKVPARKEKTSGRDRPQPQNGLIYSRVPHVAVNRSTEDAEFIGARTVP